MGKPALRNSQKKAIAFGLKHPYCILALDPRLGKTRAAIEVHEKSKRQNCLVICPGYLIDHWKFEIKKWAGEDRIVTTIKQGKEIYDLIDTDYCVISYDLSLKAPALFEWAQTVIVDEPHLYIKSMETKRTELIHKYIYENSIPSVIQLTGTPIRNRVAEFYCPVALCYYDPKTKKTDFLDRFPTSLDFADYFSRRVQYHIEVGNRRVKVVKWIGMRNIPELKSYLKGRYLRIKAKEDELPQLFFVDVAVDDSPNEKLLAAFNKHFEAEGSDSVRPDIKAEAALQKAPLTIQYATDLLEQLKTPVIIYTDHVASCEFIAKHFGVPAIHGKMGSGTRKKLADSFQAGNGNVLVATIGSLSVGIDLSRAHDLILNDPAWVPSDLTQIYNRMRKVGDKGTRFVHRIWGSPQDRKISEALTEKINVIEKVT